jgi:hypothetical protein
MKRYLIHLCLLFMSFVVSSQTTTPDSLKSALQKTTSERTRLEILANLMDISRNDDILVNAKQLYQEALKANDNYYKEAALTEILRHYINTDQTDSANVYIAKAEQELKGEARTSLVSFMKMIQDTRVIFYTSGEPRRKVLMNCLFKLEEPDKDFFFDWCDRYGHDISTEDPHLLVAHYLELFGNVTYIDDDSCPDSGDDSLLYYPGISGNYFDNCFPRFEVFDDNYD